LEKLDGVIDFLGGLKKVSFDEKMVENKLENKLDEKLLDVQK
jgi:hypothetical protein